MVAICALVKASSKCNRPSPYPSSATERVRSTAASPQAKTGAATVAVVSSSIVVVVTTAGFVLAE
jgi:hypothetical protein